MKKLTLDLIQTGTEDFIAQCGITIRVNNKEVENDLSILAKALLADLPFECTFDRAVFEYGYLKLVIKTKSGNTQAFKFKYTDFAFYNTGDYIYLNPRMPAPLVQKAIKAFVDFIKEIQEWIYSVHKHTQTHSWTWEV